MRSLQRFIQKTTTRRQTIPPSAHSQPKSQGMPYKWLDRSWFSLLWMHAEKLGKLQPRWQTGQTGTWRKQLTIIFSKLAAPHGLRRQLSKRTGLSDRWFWAGMVVLCLTSAIGYRFYSKPLLAVDTIAPQTLRAPKTATVLDVYTTESNRRAAQIGIVPVLKIDQTLNQEIYRALQHWLDAGDTLRQQAGPLPYVASGTLSTPIQRYLRQVSASDWQSIIYAVTQPDGLTTGQLSVAASPLLSTPQSIKQVAILELQNYRRGVSAEDFSALQQVIQRARQSHLSALKELLLSGENNSASILNPAFLDLTDTEWNQTKVLVRQSLERILTQGIAPGIPAELQATAIRTQVGTATPNAALAVSLLQKVIQPNLVADPEQTRVQADRAARQVQPVMITVQRGETIVTVGEQISQEDFVLLDYFGMSQRQISWLELAAFAALMSGAVALFLFLERRFHPGLRRQDYLLVLLLALTTPLLLALRLPTTSLPAVGLLLGGYYSGALGSAVVLLLSIAMPIGLEISLPLLIAGSVAGVLGAILAGKRRSREELALLGGAVGLTQGLVYLCVSLVMSAASGLVWSSLLGTALIHAALGVGWSVAALGTSPYLEQMFDLVTPIRLAELASPNRPLLKRLASEAPGTFQHTLFVATLAEAAARELGCNVELVRAGTLYHDIGKMHDALGFIENQMGGLNKHDVLDNPWKSAAIIKKHVTEGMVMAKKYRLPKAVRAFIPEHQGTMPIAYFLHEARKRVQLDPTLEINDADFHYDGPVPQSRETGLVMLADSCEAALRSLQDATPDEALAMVNRVLRSRWQEHQLVDSGLTRSDMNVIAEVFVQVWRQFHHKRIAYPKLTPTPQPPISAA